MARFSAGGLTTAGSTTLPLWSLYTGTTGRPWINQIGLWNTTSTAVALRLVRLSTTGTRGSAITPMNLSHEDPAVATASVYQTHSVAPTIAADAGYRVVLGAAPGSGVVWTWNDRVFTINPVSANNGLGCIVENGTGQPIQFYIEFGE